MKYTTPEVEILELSQVDVIETSGEEGPGTQEDGLGWG